MYKVAFENKADLIAKETRRLKKIFKELEPNKLKTVDALISRAAFITISLQELEEQLNRDGWVEEYQNGSNQRGLKKSAAAEVHISLTKNLSTIMKQLIELVPAEKKKSKLTEMRLR